MILDHTVSKGYTNTSLVGLVQNTETKFRIQKYYKLNLVCHEERLKLPDTFINGVALHNTKVFVIKNDESNYVRAVVVTKVVTVTRRGGPNNRLYRGLDQKWL